jgi:aminoglycoside 3-N-acetyltransferase
MSDENKVRHERSAVDLGGPFTRDSLLTDLRMLGVAAGMTVIAHTSMSALGGWVVGGAQTVVMALLDAVGETGTLVMPTHTTNNSDPAYWRNPPIPESWWPVVREHQPAFEPDKTPTRAMGVINELFRTFPGVLRSIHPNSSAAAHGPNAAYITANHPLEHALGEGSPYARVVELDGYILLLGVDHGNNTTLHLAEHRASFPGKRFEPQSGAMLVNGVRQWVTYDDMVPDDEDFAQIGLEFEVAHPRFARVRAVGNGTARLVAARPLIDFAVKWIEAHRK